MKRIEILKFVSVASSEQPSARSNKLWYSTAPILRAPIIRGAPQLRGLLAAEFSSQKFLVKRGKPEFSSLRSIVLILNRPPVEQ